MSAGEHEGGLPLIPTHVAYGDGTSDVINPEDMFEPKPIPQELWDSWTPEQQNQAAFMQLLDSVPDHRPKVEPEPAPEQPHEVRWYHIAAIWVGLAIVITVILLTGDRS